MILWYDRSGRSLVMLGSGSLSVIIELSEARNKLVTRVNQDHWHTVIQCIFGGVGFYEP